MEYSFYFGLTGLIGLGVFFSIFFTVRLIKIRKKLNTSGGSENNIQEKVDLHKARVAKLKILAELNELNNIDVEFQNKIKRIEGHLKAL